jgi:pimeloyl-ACP methyl ester carboxylesterase
VERVAGNLFSTYRDQVIEADVKVDGRTLHTYSWGDGDLVVMWHHGTPNIGIPPAPLFAAAERLGIRFIAYDRPGYGGSTPVPDRPVASAATDAAAVADALGVRGFAVLGHAGGASLRAAAAGRAAKEAYVANPANTGIDFTAGDWAALEGPWGWFGSVVEPAVASGPAPLIDDDLAYVSPWGFDPAAITAPVLLVHGAGDLVVPAAHSSWLAERIKGAELRLAPEAGHIAVLPEHAEGALAWAASVTRTPENA